MDFEEAIEKVTVENREINDEEPPNNSFEASNDDDSFQNIMFKRKVFPIIPKKNQKTDHNFQKNSVPATKIIQSF